MQTTAVSVLIVGEYDFFGVASIVGGKRANYQLFSDTLLTHARTSTSLAIIGFSFYVLLSKIVNKPLNVTNNYYLLLVY